MTDPTPAAAGSNASTGIGPRLAARLEEACGVIAPVPRRNGVFAGILPIILQETGAFRASLMAPNPDTGRLRIVEAVGLAPDLVGRDVVPRGRAISDWVFRQRCGLVLNGEIRDRRFEGSGSGRGIESALSVPLEFESRVAGVLNLARKPPMPSFREEDLATLAECLTPLAASLERATAVLLAERARRQIQTREKEPERSLLARGGIEVGHFEMAACHVPSVKHGGDLCDRVFHDTGAQTLLLLDVSGEGAAAAISAAFVQGLLLALALPQRSAAGMVARLNREIRARLGDRTIAGLWVGQLSKHGELSYCNAGFPPPLWVPGDGSPAARLDRGGPVAGAPPGAAFDEERLQMLPGDLIVAVSDGLLEARDRTDQPFGEERVREVISDLRRHPLEHLTREICRSAGEYSGLPDPVDDFMAFALRYLPGG